MVLKQQGLTLIRAVRLMGRDGGEELVNFVIVKYGGLEAKDGPNVLSH